MVRSEIVIKKVHNGWIVQLPEPSKSSIASDLMQDYLSKMPQMFKQIDNESDDVMAKLRKANEPEEEFMEELRTEPFMDSAENMLIFKTFPEVLEFLSNNIE